MPSGKATATEIITATSTSAIVCIEAIHKPISQQKPRAQIASRLIRQLASSQASTATSTMSTPAGRTVRASCTTVSTASTTVLIAAKRGWTWVFSQSTPGATKAPGEKVKGSSAITPPPAHP